MYKYINRPDCFYTDTDSTILGSPLPEDETSSTELGKFKLEHRLKKGIFLAPKSYALETEEDVDILKHKGAAKQFVNIEWFQSLLAAKKRYQLKQTFELAPHFKERIPSQHGNQNRY